ncbi:unnamed protein product [Albugo candida]|nr:unnamed protein product [Albugo candida]|eukprot:CCI49926.1 unnamed protein product [Albugo candida]
MSSSSQSFALQPRVAGRYEFYTPTLSEESLDTRDEAFVFSPTQEQRVEIPRRRRQRLRTISAGELGVIIEDKENHTPLKSIFSPEFSSKFVLNSEGRVCDGHTNQLVSKEMIRAHGEVIVAALITYVHTQMLQEYLFVEQVIPALDYDVERVPFTSSCGIMESVISNTKMIVGSQFSDMSASICSTTDGFRTMIDTSVPRCVFHTSADYSVAEKLLVFVCSSRGLSCGIWSRSIMLNDGVNTGSMIPYFQQALALGYGVLVMNPNMNAQMMIDKNGNHSKVAIEGSSTQEEHVEHVWQNYIFPSAAQKIHFIAYGYGGQLVTDLINKYFHELKNRLGNVALIESNHKIDAKWSSFSQRFFSEHSICWRQSQHMLINSVLSRGSHPSDGNESVTRGIRNTINISEMLETRETRQSKLQNGILYRGPAASSGSYPATNGMNSIGCLCLSAGSSAKNGGVMNPAYTTHIVREAVFEFLAAPSTYEYEHQISRKVRLRRRISERIGLNGPGDRKNARSSQSNSAAFLGLSQRKSCTGNTDQSSERIGIDDFDLLHVVGRGAFGKVMLVRRKSEFVHSRDTLMKKKSKFGFLQTLTNGFTGQGFVTKDSQERYQKNEMSENGRVYAMKVIQKSAVFKKRQVEHTKSERRILQSINHPFIVQLRYAFQTRTKLYFVMDYYQGGSLNFHLTSLKVFTEAMTRFYAAQLVLAISHLHTYNIVYRDLKPDNILMDEEGYLALADFGLSQDRYDPKGGLLTFCGTAEYIAPELIRRIPYGKSVDYWSLGILIFEMLAGFTPFFHYNRQHNFRNILDLPLQFPPTFSDDVKSLLRALLVRDPSKRLGSGQCGVQEIKDYAFFYSIDWEQLYKRQIRAPYQPRVREMEDVSNVPVIFKHEEARDSVSSEVDEASHQVFDGFTYIDPWQSQEIRV